MCVGPTIRPFHFHVAVEHPIQGGACLFEVRFYAPLSSRLVTELIQLLHTHQEGFLMLHQRVVEQLTPYATVRVDPNIEAAGESVDEIMAELDGGEFYFLVPVGEQEWTHISVAEDPLGECVFQALGLASA